MFSLLRKFVDKRTARDARAVQIVEKSRAERIAMQSRFASIEKLMHDTLHELGASNPHGGIGKKE
ncbi:hypothetical protein RCDURKIN_52 [Rhodobacter phage RcDurkin]|nr:hypothetical protein RCDURKIN_52 [Rhodobacter phage RcDurkin]QXN72522.1 hypothetical protein RCTIPTONUS_52 [Rhodobacter phage RcTiptonus]UUV43796.1 hypothetical protein RCKICKAPOO_55 [Rhodobacter phage RcKickapoo]UUV44423.1 hypothetical protein RCMENCHIE_54 [Rhodobacter phage RcMenchie]